MPRGRAPPENECESNNEANAGSDNQWQQGGQATCECGFYRRRENPELRDIYHDQQYQARLCHCGAAATGMTAGGAGGGSGNLVFHLF